MKQLDASNILLARSTVTSTATGAAVSAASLKGSDPFAVVTSVTAIDNGGGDETYVLTVEASADSGFSSPTTIASETIDRDTTAPFTVEIPLSGRYLLQKLPTAEYVRAVLTLGGASPSITPESFIQLY